MPLSSDFKHSKYAPVDTTRVIDSVTSMTRSGKGVGFGSMSSSRFSDMGSPNSSPVRRRPSTSGSLPPCSPVSVGSKTVSMYGKERQLENGSLNASNSQWNASMGLATKPKPFTSEELEKRRTRPLGGTTSSGPVVIVDDELAGRQRPGSRTHNWGDGRRSTPDNWGGGRRGVDSPGPIYVQNETFYRDMTKCEDRHSLSIIMMERQTTGLLMGKGKRFTPGMGSFETMVPL